MWRGPTPQPPPPLADRSRATAIFETGIKVIDLLAPLAQGGKGAMFGGAGVGKTVVFGTHAVREAVALARRIALLEAGRLAFLGTVQQFAASTLPQVAALLVVDANGGELARSGEVQEPDQGELLADWRHCRGRRLLHLDPQFPGIDSRGAGDDQPRWLGRRSMW